MGPRTLVLSLGQAAQPRVVGRLNTMKRVFLFWVPTKRYSCNRRSTANGEDQEPLGRVFLINSGSMWNEKILFFVRDELQKTAKIKSNKIDG
jgi:hypothetical protein